jgi:hypothetical protein
VKPDVKAMGATLAAARTFVKETRDALQELRRRRAMLNAEGQELEAKPLRWEEALDELVDRAIDDCASRYKPSLGAWIRASNPSLATRNGYSDLPFLGVPDESESALLQNVGLLDGVNSHAACFFGGAELKARLRAVLREYPQPYPDDQGITAAERDTQRTALREQMDAIDGDIARLQGELAELQLER